MFPGYGAFGPYRSPIRIDCVVPLGTGRGHLRLSFYNANYASGVRDFVVLCRTIKLSEGFIAIELLNDDGTDTGRIAVIVEGHGPPSREV
jgi:hypothetical protein